jgi:hypothetical protein
MNREVGYCLRNFWKPLICFFRKPLQNDARSTRLHGSCTLGSSSSKGTGSKLAR